MTPKKLNYERNHSHTHCWEQDHPSACGIPLEKHTQCCLCEMQYARGSGGYNPDSPQAEERESWGNEILGVLYDLEAKQLTVDDSFRELLGLMKLEIELVISKDREKYKEEVVREIREKIRNMKKENFGTNQYEAKYVLWKGCLMKPNELGVDDILENLIKQ